MDPFGSDAGLNESAMTIEVKCFASLDRFQPDEANAFPIESGETVGQVMARMGIPPRSVALIFINNVHAKTDAVLKDGDTVGFFPPIGGG